MKKHTRWEWCQIFDITIMDDDGWRNLPVEHRDRPTTFEEFVTRLNESTIRFNNIEKGRIFNSIS